MGVKEVSNVDVKYYELVPPDGGWGYMICFSAIIVYSTTTMFTACFGMIFKDFLIELDMGSTSVTLLGGINAMSIAVAGFVTSPLLKVMSKRKLAFLAAALYNLGAFGTVFVNTKLMFFIVQGPLQFTGFGILYNIACTQINEYFLKKRLFAISLAQTISAAAAMAAPQLIKWSLDIFGFRGTLMIISAISLNTFIAAALMQPVEWHMIKVELPKTTKDEIKLLLVQEKSVNGTDENTTTPTIAITNIESSFDTNISVKGENGDVQAKEGEKDSETKQIIKDLWDVPLMKKFFLSNASMGPTFCVFADGIFSIMLPQALYSMGWGKDMVAQAISMQSLGDLITRASLIFLSKWLSKIGSQEVYIIGLAIAVITRLGMLWSENVTWVLIYITIMGISRCTVCIFPPLIFSESFSTDEFSKAMGYMMMTFGILNLVLGPAIGAVRDLTDSYPTAFYVIVSCFSAVILLWSIELVYKKNKHKRKILIEMRAKNYQNKSDTKNKGK